MAKFIGGLILSFVLVLCSISAQAAPGWYICEITSTGVSSNGEKIVQLTDVGTPRRFKDKYFTLSRSADNEMLAIALTALSGGQQVTVFTDLDERGSPEILNISVSR